MSDKHKPKLLTVSEDIRYVDAFSFLTDFYTIIKASGVSSANKILKGRLTSPFGDREHEKVTSLAVDDSISARGIQKIVRQSLKHPEDIKVVQVAENHTFPELTYFETGKDNGSPIVVKERALKEYLLPKYKIIENDIEKKMEKVADIYLSAIRNEDYSSVEDAIPILNDIEKTIHAFYNENITDTQPFEKVFLGYAWKIRTLRKGFMEISQKQGPCPQGNFDKMLEDLVENGPMLKLDTFRTYKGPCVER